MNTNFTIEWKEQEDGTFHLCIPEKSEQQFYLQNYQDDQLSGRGAHFGYTLLEEMLCNSEYSLATPLDIYLSSLPLDGGTDRIFERVARGEHAHAAQCKEYAAHPNQSPLGWKMYLRPDQPLIAVYDLPDDGVVPNVEKIWLLPEEWLRQILLGEIIIAHPSPTTRTKQQFLSYLAWRWTTISWDKKQEKYSINPKQPTTHGYGPLLSVVEQEDLKRNGYIEDWNAGHFIKLTEKGFLATGRTLEKTHQYQLDEEGQNEEKGTSNE